MLLLLNYAVCAQESFKLPQSWRGTPIEYLENIKVKDVSHQLSDKEKHDLCRMFASAYAVSARKHHQDYFLNTRADIYRLLASNFPQIKERESEEGAIIFLGSITSFFNALSEYRGDVLQVLRQGINGDYCN